MHLFVRPALLGVLVTVAASACTLPVNTVPDQVAPSDPVQYYDLDIPDYLDVRTVDFDAVQFVDPKVHVAADRGFLKVYAVDRKSGEQYLLIYENVSERKEPVQVIRFHGVASDSSMRRHPPA